MIDNLLKFPGLAWVSDLLAVTILIALQVTAFVLFLAVLKFYVKGETKVSRIVGSLIGILAGVFFASGHTRTLGHYFQTNDAVTSMALVAFIAMNVVITLVVYTKNASGGANAANPSP